MNTNTQQLIGKSAEYLRVMHAVRMVAVTDTTVLLKGEKGTGKATLAAEIHRVSYRRDRGFTVLPCSAGAEDVIASLLSAHSEALNAGTLYLDEVADLSLAAQGLLMAFLEQRELAGKTADVRIIAATSEDLFARVQSGAFREDLFYRLYIVPVEIPALRDRPDDIALFLKHFTAELARKHNRKAPIYSVTAKNLLKRYLWPGNLRELRNFCERMVILMAGQNIQPENLPIEIRQNDEHAGKVGFVLPKAGINLLDLESDVIRQALEMAGGNRSRAARLLGISRDTLLYRIQKHEIQV